VKRFTEFLFSQSRVFYLLFALLALLGVLAYRNLPSAVYPELSFPRIAAIAEIENMSPERVALIVTRPLEEAASQVNGVRWIRSKTIRGSTELSIEFQPGTDMPLALQQLQTRIAEARNALPSQVALTVERITPAIFPVITYNLSSSTLTQSDLYLAARYQILPQLTRVPGVARVQVQGGDIPQILVEVDPIKLKGYGLALSNIVDAIGRTNQTHVVGKLDDRSQQNLVVGSAESITISDLENIVVTTREQHIPVFLKDVAQVHIGRADPTKIVTVNGVPGVSLSIFRQPNSSVVQVSKEVKQELSKLRPSLIPGIQIRPAYDESNFVVEATNNVRDAILIGIALILIILFLFLREWRSTIIAALTIPLSALMAFIVLKLTHQSLNLMSLGGIAVAVGLVIDDAIVVIENINRQLHQGLDIKSAVAAAGTELIGPVVSSTITTVVVFSPLVLLSGVAGAFFTSLTLSLSAAVIFSLILAFTLIPLLSAQWLREASIHEAQVGLLTVDRHYKVSLENILKKPHWVGMAALVLFVFGILLFTRLGSDFLPTMDEGNYMIDYLAPPGTSLAETDSLVRKIESILAKTPEIETWTRRTGAESGLFATETNKGDLLVVLKPRKQRHRGIFDIIDSQRQQFASEIPQLEVDFHQILQDQLNDLSGTSNPIEVKIFGEDPPQLRSLAALVRTRIEKVSGLVDLAIAGATQAPELNLRVDPVKASRLGLTPEEVELQASEAMLGAVATQVRSGDRLEEVRVRLSAPTSTNAEALQQIPITGANGVTVPLRSVAAVAPGFGEAEIDRENQRRYILVKANLDKRDLGSSIRDVQARLEDLKLPSGYSLSIGGLYASQQQAFRELLSVLTLAVLLVYLVLVAQFRSLSQPLVILTTVPLALFGVTALLWITNTPLNVSSFMGIILLVGLVVKNGILLLEYTNRMQRGGQSLDEALIEAGRIRMRPILMTTLCTLLGLVPLAFGLGAGAELQKPLAIAVIGGLSLSTFFTLFFIPVVFRTIEKRD